MADTMQALERWWTWGLGELPAERPAVRDHGLWVLLALIGLAMGMGELYPVGVEPLPKGAWRLAAHGGPCLAVVAALASGSRVGRGLAAALALAPIAWRLVDVHGVHDNPGVVVALMIAAATVTRLAVGQEAWSAAGLGLGDVKWWGPRAALGVGLVIAGVSLAVYLSPGMRAFYPSWKPARTDAVELGWQLVGIAFDFVSWEVMFRGVILQVIARRGDPRVAIAFQTVPFFLLHWHKPLFEFWTSLPGGVVAGWFCLRAGSFLPLWMLHFVMYATAAVTAFLLR